jgi:hypothetical protein
MAEAKMNIKFELYTLVSREFPVGKVFTIGFLNYKLNGLFGSCCRSKTVRKMILLLNSFPDFPVLDEKNHYTHGKSQQYQPRM